MTRYSTTTPNLQCRNPLFVKALILSKPHDIGHVRQRRSSSLNPLFIRPKTTVLRVRHSCPLKNTKAKRPPTYNQDGVCEAPCPRLPLSLSLRTRDTNMNPGRYRPLFIRSQILRALRQRVDRKHAVWVVIPYSSGRRFSGSIRQTVFGG